ncbi:hypothetical protein L6452_34479 [Arctium lappa]|uniref:Uncharacterized protein n=1 Tax=Arctium lappa TaxID=4217 RepID=A0ACB8YJG4_ARCLA|nr:hypothetical protein L6452_34479 [Arctium lappa]
MTHYNSISPPASVSPTVSMAKSEDDHHDDAPPNSRTLEKESTVGNFSQLRHQSSHRNGSLGLDVVENNIMEINIVKNIFDEGESEPVKTVKNETEAYHPSIDDFQIWLPPEADDQEDDVEGSVVNYEDDDDDEEEFGDGMKWGKPSNLSSFRQEGSGSIRFREEKRRAMDEVMSGKFKALVEHLLNSMGISCSRNDGDTWVDTVTSLSWEAASFMKPDAFEGKAMDPDGYVKVKCIATGSRSQSEVFKGLVFKKHAAHKHMPTRFKRPKLLLIKGALSGSDGFSSFESMKQEKNRLDSVIGMIEKCNPNVVLVEKTVSRDIQEFILAKGMTLVLEMKMHRLERVARCTGSPILSSDKLSDEKLRQCDSFYFEKIIEEHAAVCESGKRPRKTLMFLEGCPKRMGCTILLKGSHSDELKKIKSVVQFAVVMAFHLILESSFLLNQRAMFSTISPIGLAMFSSKTPIEEIIPSISNQPLDLGFNDSNIPVAKESNAGTDSVNAMDVPISTEFHEKGSESVELEGDALLSYEPYNPVFLSGLSSLSASLKKVVGFPLFNPNQSMSTYFSSNGVNSPNQTGTSVQVLSSLEAVDAADVGAKVSSDEDKILDSDQLHFSLTSSKDSSETKGPDEQMQSKDDINTVLESESILVLMSKRNATRGSICEHNRFSCIKFYRNFDIPLGKFLRDNLLDQKLLCRTCDEPPEAHSYYYAHHDMQLTIQVRRLPMDKHLPGENEGKLWMWSSCGKCKPCNGSLKSTKRVLVSTAARSLSFGKFLELGFSNHSCDIPSSCGHFFHRDYFHFFGLGSMVAMFRYSLVATYSVSLPHWKVEFSNSIGGKFLKKEVEDVYEEGLSMFAEVERSLRKMEFEFVGSMLNLQGSLKKFSDIEEMLNRERDQFEVDMKNTANYGNTDDASKNNWVYKPLCLNHVQWELLLESCIWDQRLHSLLSSDLRAVNPKSIEEDDSTGHRPEGTVVVSQSGEEDPDDIAELKSNLETPEGSSLLLKEISIEGDTFSNQDVFIESGSSNHSEVGEENGLNYTLAFSSRVGKSGKAPVTEDAPRNTVSDVKGRFSFSLSAKLEDPKGWMWTPFQQIQSAYMNDLQRGYLPEFEPINSYTAGSRIYKMITEEGSRLHFPLGTDNYMVSDYDDELSSIIACALAFLKDQNISPEDLNEETKLYGSSQKMSSFPSSNWSSFGSVDADSTSLGIPSEESHFFSFDGLELLDSVASSRYLHPVVSMGRLASKAKYSVACLFANDFLHLRSQCGLSELDFVASLSRCKHWDAKGGKSKSFFAKTLDDRFIIKEIKKTESYSFLEFASDYFGYMDQCFKLGNQTCLAKILGIYQVKKRKSGAKHDLMVMENITYRRNVVRQYDLKGALHARFNSAVDGAGDVLLDQNFVNDMNVSPLYVNRKAKRNLQRAVWNDTAFLNSINVMDYSLLVGVDAEEKELVCGIIDYVRQYTWDKQLENWVKLFVVPKNQLPTVISPKEYKKRFRKFIDTHFLSVPDDWCSQRSSNRCSLCGTGCSHSNSSAGTKSG